MQTFIGRPPRSKRSAKARLQIVLVNVVFACVLTSAADAHAGPDRGAQIQSARIAATGGSSAKPGVLAPDSAPLALPAYSGSSPFNEEISPTHSIAAESTQMVRSMLRAEAEKGFVLTVGRWTVPIYVAARSTPTQTVRLRQAPPQWHEPPSYLGFPPGWSESLDTPLPDLLRGVPIPTAAEPDPSLDAHMTIIDSDSNCEFDLYGAHKSAEGWEAIWMNSTRLSGAGVYPAGMGTTASGFAGNAGLIWPQELRNGGINHALLFAYPFTKAGGPVWPATSSDGLSSAPGAMPEGTRIQLNPSLDVSSLSLPPYEEVIAKALQRYGMILGDTGGAMGLFGVGSQSFNVNPYEGVLPRGSYPTLSGIPVSQFRVLASGPQQSRPRLGIEESGCGSFE